MSHLALPYHHHPVLTVTIILSSVMFPALPRPCLQVEKGTQGIDGRVNNPRVKGEPTDDPHTTQPQYNTTQQHHIR